MVTVNIICTCPCCGEEFEEEQEVEIDRNDFINDLD